jgi:HEAT repeat protein
VLGLKKQEDKNGWEGRWKGFLPLGGLLLIAASAIVLMESGKDGVSSNAARRKLDGTKKENSDRIKKEKTISRCGEYVNSEQSHLNGRQENGVKDGNKKNHVKELIEKIKNTDWRIRAKAQEELVKIGNAAVTELIKAVSGSSLPPHARSKAISVLGKIGDARALNSLVGALSDENSYVRRCAAESLGAIKDLGALNPLVKALYDENVSVRERAAIALGKLNDERAVASLIEKLLDKHERVRVSAIRSLVAIKDNKAVQPLMKQLARNYSQLYKNNVAWALGELNEREALPILESYLKKLETGKPKEDMARFQWQFAVKTAKEAVSKLR